MGLFASKRVKKSLANSSEFDAACDSAFAHCLSLTQHAFHGVLPYQLLTASDHIHHSLLSPPDGGNHRRRLHSLVVKWVPNPPTRAQVDSALKKVTHHLPVDDDSFDVIGSTRFKEWAVVLYVDAVVNNAGKAVLSRVPIGIAGIAGIGALTGSRRELVGTAIGAYALGVATSIFLSLSG